MVGFLAIRDLSLNSTLLSVAQVGMGHRYPHSPLGEFDTVNVNPMDPCLNHTVPGPYPVSIHRAVQLRPVRSFLSLDTLRALRTLRWSRSRKSSAVLAATSWPKHRHSWACLKISLWPSSIFRPSSWGCMWPHGVLEFCRSATACCDYGGCPATLWPVMYFQRRGTLGSMPSTYMSIHLNMSSYAQLHVSNPSQSHFARRFWGCSPILRDPHGISIQMTMVKTLFQLQRLLESVFPLWICLRIIMPDTPRSTCLPKALWGIKSLQPIQYLSHRKPPINLVQIHDSMAKQQLNKSSANSVKNGWTERAHPSVLLSLFQLYLLGTLLCSPSNKGQDMAVVFL